MSYAVEQDDTEDRYYTQVDAGDVRLFTLDQLDAAFNAGLIHENTYVCLEGGSEWLTLGEVAGLGDEEEPAAPEPVSVVAPIPQRAVAAPSVAPAAPYSVAPAVSAVPAAPYSVAPVVTPSTLVTPNTIRPVVSDLGLDDLDSDMLAMRPKRRAGKIVAGIAVAGVAALGFFVVTSGGIKLPKLDKSVGQASAASLSPASLSDSKPAQLEAPAPTPAPEPAKPEPPKAEEKPAEPASAEAKSESSDASAEKKSDDDRFSEEMKAALLAKDKKQALDKKSSKKKPAARPTVAARKTAKSGKASGNFKASGSAYDPLNGKL